MSTQLNFNLKENQDRCIYRAYPPFNGKIRYGGVSLQYFIHNRNYEWMHYNGKLFNLNKNEEANQFIQLLKDEEFLLERNGNYTIRDLNYENFVCIPRHMLLFFMYYTKGQPLTQLECLEMDKQFKLK